MRKKDFLYWMLLSLGVILIYIFLFGAQTSDAKPPKNLKSKFYDFSEQLIDGEIKKPTALYTDARKRAEFDRLLSLKKSMLPRLYRTSKEKAFK